MGWIGMRVRRLARRVRMCRLRRGMRVRRDHRRVERDGRRAALCGKGARRAGPNRENVLEVWQIEIRARAAKGVADDGEQQRVSRRVERRAVADQPVRRRLSP